MSSHGKLVERARQAIDRVHQDVSVDLEETAASLSDLRDYISELWSAVKEDIDFRQGAAE